MRRLAGAIAGAVVALGVLVAMASPAAAHATLQTTTPAADEVLDDVPARVELVFDEDVNVDLGGLRVVGPDGERVDTGGTDVVEGGLRVVTRLDAAARGTFTVGWRVVSDDGHPLSGSFVFHVGAPTGRADISDDTGIARPVGAAARWLAFAGAAVAAGSVALVLMMGSDVDGSRRALRRLVVFAAVATALGGGGALLAQVALASGRTLGDAVSVVGDAIADTRFGALGAARFALATLLVLAGALTRWDRRRPPAVVLGAIAAALVVVPAPAGHAWTAPPRWLAVGVDAVHLLAVAGWVGGLAALLLALRPAESRARVASRFSRFALWAAAAVVATGATSSLIEVRSFDALTTTGYGRLLIAKIALVAGLLALGWVNRRRLLPDPARAAQISRVVAGEVALVAVVFAVTSVLVTRPPARDAETGPFSTTVTTGTGVIDVVVDPADPGPNNIHVYFLDSNSQPRAVDAVEITAGTAVIPARKLEVFPLAPGHVSVAGAALSPAGVWRLTITAVTGGQPESTTIEVPIR